MHTPLVKSLKQSSVSIHKIDMRKRPYQSNWTSRTLLQGTLNIN